MAGMGFFQIPALLRMVETSESKGGERWMFHLKLLYCFLHSLKDGWGFDFRFLQQGLHILLQILAKA